MLWKANIDIPFVAEASLVLAHYVSGYVTKAESSNMQEIWQEVSENKIIIYSLLVSEVYGLESVVCMRQVICSWETTTLGSLTQSSG